MEKQNLGISLISLIITIIVIIILAAIVIFSGMGTPEKAQLSAVISDIDNVQTAVDQAYYGLYTEKSVEGEVWTKSQYYESVATGEMDRSKLSGTGIVEISEEGRVKMNLPKYEGRKWGVAVEDIDETTTIGSVVLIPGFETDNKVYSTQLDIQTGGRDSQLNETVNTNINVTDSKITTDSGATTLAGEKIEEGTKLYISFDVSQNESVVTVTPSLPYEITKNGSYSFTLTNAEGKVREYKVKVKNYLVPTLTNIVKLGDYIEYTPDSKSYTTRPEYTGYNTAQTLSTEKRNWRVICVDEDTGKTYLVPDKAVNSGIRLFGLKGYFNGTTELNEICTALYSNKENEIYAKCLTPEDYLQIVCKRKIIGEKFVNGYAYYPFGTVLSGDSTIEHNGTKYIKAVHSSKGSARFYVGWSASTSIVDETNGFSYRVPTSDAPVFVEETKLITSESGLSSEENIKAWQILHPDSTIVWYGSGTILENSFMALTQDAVSNTRDYSMACYSTTYGEGSVNLAICPIVEINSSFLIDKLNNPTRDGSTPDKAWKIIKK